MSAESVDRRPFLKAVAGGTVALTAVGVGARVALHRDRDGGGGEGDLGTSGPALVLSAEAGTDIASVTVRLDDRLLPEVAERRWESARLATSTHTMLAFTWTDLAASPHLQVRTRRERGGWDEWQRVPLLRDLPDRDSGEGGLTTGTEMVWVGAADGVQVRLKGRRPGDLAMLLLHPARRKGDARGTSQRGPSQRAAVNGRADAVVVRPTILDRVMWGADESWRSGTPRINATIEQVHVHHTVSSNTYLPDDVPAMIRGFYRYHTKTLGWSDIAYNFLVDRFGRIWTGRAGGANKPVRGAHTLGFNATSCGVSVIGQLDQVAPTNETLEAIAAVAAWKLDLYSRDPLGSAAVRSEGSDRFRSGSTVTLPVIDGHRDTNDTTCPGGYLYAALPDIRNRAAARIAAAVQAAQTPVAVLAATTIEGAALLGQTLTARTGSYDPPGAVPAVTWLRDGAPVASGATYVVAPADIGHQLTAQVGVTADGRSPATESVSAGAGYARPVVTVTTEPKRRRAIVRVKVSAPPGVDVVPEGRVVVKMDKRRSKTITLRNGRGSTRFMHVAAGPHDVKAVYLGGGPITRSSGKARVSVS